MTVTLSRYLSAAAFTCVFLLALATFWEFMKSEMPESLLWLGAFNGYVAVAYIYIGRYEGRE